jgi:hypothetical protein
MGDKKTHYLQNLHHSRYLIDYFTIFVASTVLFSTAI